jgi:hypothetical protein
MAPDGAAIDWDRCRDLFLVPLLQRLEKRSNSPHPAIVRGLLQRRLAGEDVTAELSAANADANAAAAAADDADATTWANYAATWANCAANLAAAAVDAANWAANWAADADADAERADQVADLQAAVAASSRQPALPARCGHITGLDRELQAVFYTACNSEGGSADEIYLRGIHAVIAQAAGGVKAKAKATASDKPQTGA